jgi:predicted dehydrogenase
MDVGCYCISFARLFAGEEPTAISAVATNHPSGVDQVAAGTLLFPSNVIATFTCGTTVQASNTAYLCGSDGYIEVPIPWKPPPKDAEYSLVRATPPRMDDPKLIASGSVANAGPRQTFTVSADKELYAIEADDFADTVLDGKPQTVTRADTIGNVRVLDAIRRQLATGN